MTYTTSSIRTLLSIAVFALFLFAGCKDNNTDTEQENITSIEIDLAGFNINQKFYWKDLDGPGGNPPVIDTIVLPASTLNITGRLKVYDESKNPVDDITEEIEAENTAHLFVYSVANADLIIEPNDTDDNGDPFSLVTVWKAGQPSTGTLNIRLYHEPTDKMNTANPGGEADFDVTFPVRIE
ncbi:MAG: hypothetical protein IPK76_01580 [Lewinellaceae bacterium]|jgi:hypothetical protein|nr:hypothetical protein [Lewinellaceae bacterium]